MKNNGLFSSLFIEELKDVVELDDAAQGRMATLAQTWRSRNSQDTESLWESFLKQALSYLEFVPPGNPTAPGVYPLFDLSHPLLEAGHPGRKNNGLEAFPGFLRRPGAGFEGKRQRGNCRPDP